MFRATDFIKRDIINLTDGARLGPVKDLHIDIESGRIKALVLQGPRHWGLLRAGQDIVIPWEKIRKIGVNAILVEVD